jgi:hypothetical protein
VEEVSRSTWLGSRTTFVGNELQPAKTSNAAAVRSNREQRIDDNATRLRE